MGSTITDTPAAHDTTPRPTDADTAPRALVLVARRTAQTARRARRDAAPVELNAWGAKKRPSSFNVETAEDLFRDPPREVQRLMGGSAWFFSIGATGIHRVGLFQGMAWVLPHSGVKNDMNYAKITLNKDKKTFDLFLGKVDMKIDMPPESIQILVTCRAVEPSKLKWAYEQETIDEHDAAG